MLRRFALVLAIAAFGASSAMAHGPTRQKVVTKIEISAPAEKVWAAVGNFQDMGWHPIFKSTEGAGGNDVGATRTLTLQSGGKVEEALTRYSTEKRSYAYEITKLDVKDLPVNNYSSSITVEESGDKSVVIWKGAFYRGFLNNDPPPELSDEAALKAVKGLYQDGLAALKTKVEGGS